jgi:hypothetical protein
MLKIGVKSGLPTHVPVPIVEKMLKGFAFINAIYLPDVMERVEGPC